MNYLTKEPINRHFIIGIIFFFSLLYLTSFVVAQTHEVLTSESGFPLPVEVLGSEGSTVTVSFCLSQNEVNQAESLWLQVNSLDYENKGAISINGGSFYLLNHSSVEMQHQEEARGGMAHGGFNTIRFSIPVSNLIAGENTITFKYNLENGLSSGYRVVRLNFLTSGGNQILPDSYFLEDDPSSWVGPYTDQNSIDEGKNLWYNANLWNNSLPSGQTGFWYDYEILASVPIRAKCADCHTQDGRDLEIFSYSNKSIVERAKFHQLSEEEGKKIASYIRSLSSTANKVGRYGRPWNPPFQPGVELDGKPWEEWVAGAGLDAVLDEDADMLDHMFPNGVNANTVEEYFDSDEISDWTEVPLAIQFPDWKRWLPMVHPKDAFVQSWYDQTYNSWTYNPERAYVNYRAYLEGKSGGPGTRINIAGSNPTQMMNNHLEYWKNHRFFGAQYNNGTAIDTDKHWRSTLGDALDNLSNGVGYELASTSIARLMAVKNFEFNHEFELMDQAPNYLNAADQPSNRQWFHHGESKHVFEVPPHITGCVVGGCQEFLGQETRTGQYESTNWYQLQMVLSGGNGNQSWNGPVDYNYHPEFILKASWSSKIYEPLRYYFSLNHMYQTKTWTGDTNPNNGLGFRIRVMGPWYFLGKEADAGKSQLHNWDPAVFPTLLDDVSPGLTKLVLEAQIAQFLKEINKNQNNLNNWVRFDDSNGGSKAQNLDSENKSSVTNVVLPFSSDVPLYADHMWWVMNECENLGIDQGLIDQMEAWCEDAWPNINWDDEPKCYGVDLPSANFTLTHESVPGANDGAITFSFEDDAVNGGTRTNLEFSIDDGETFPVNVPDNSGSYTFSNLAPGKYKLWVRWGDDACENKLGEPSIQEGSDSGSEEYFQSGVVNVAMPDANTWVPVSFSNSMPAVPIIAAGPITYNGGDPSTMRIRNVTTNGFEIQVDEWDYLNGSHNNAEDIYYMAVLPGNHDFGGIKMEAGSLSATSSWSTHNLSQQFNGVPVVLAVQVTNNETDATYQRLRNISASSFEIKLKEQEANTQSHVAETIHYIALDKGTGTIDGQRIEVGTTGESVDEIWYTQSFGQSYSSSGLLAHIQTETGTDPVSLRQRDLSGSNVAFLVQEEKSSDSEVGHSPEEVGWVRIENIGQGARVVSHEIQPVSEEENLKLELKFYPNPISEKLILETSKPGYLEIVDVFGRIVDIEGVNTPKLTIDMSGLRTGMYFIKYTYENGNSEIYKIIKL